MHVPEWYSCVFPAMISAWRRASRAAAPACAHPFDHRSDCAADDREVGPLPFLFVEICADVSPPWADGSAGGRRGPLPALRHAQLAALGLPRVGMVPSIDLGDPTSPWGSIHPTRKQQIAARLFNLANRIVYGASPPSPPADADADAVGQPPTITAAPPTWAFVSPLRVASVSVFFPSSFSDSPVASPLPPLPTPLLRLLPSSPSPPPPSQTSLLSLFPCLGPLFLLFGLFPRFSLFFLLCCFTSRRPSTRLCLRL